jgi:hypothetical protein
MAFVLFYTSMSIPLGTLVNRYNRRDLMIPGIILWSLMTMLCGLANDFWSLLAARAGIGIGDTDVGGVFTCRGSFRTRSSRPCDRRRQHVRPFQRRRVFLPHQLSPPRDQGRYHPTCRYSAVSFLS